MQAFYQDVLGFAPLEAAPGHRHARTARRASRRCWSCRPRPTRRRGHAARRACSTSRSCIRIAPALARALQRVLELGVPIGSADHGVSEAIYLSDPEGNGIELYADRPPEAWPPRGPDGQVTMYTEALDIPAVLAVAHQPGPLLPADARASAMSTCRSPISATPSASTATPLGSR